jgi:DNA-binding CsgD family transcriptional regulator
MAEEAKLARLTLEETALMTTLILATGLPAPRDVVAAVHERTDGVPLHIEELLGVLSDEQRTDARAILNAAVPDTLEDAFLRRVGRLSPEAQAVARAGAVIGRCFIPGVLAGVMDRPADSLDLALQELVDHHVLYPFGSPDRGFHDFRHQLLRDALYRSLPEVDRRRLHARAGEFGAVLEGQSEIHASLHYERAGMHAQAFRAALHGARAAARLSSHREAFELYRRAVENMADDLPQLERAGVLAEYAGEAAAVEETDAGDWAAGQARQLYAAAGDMVAAVEQDIVLAGFARRRARPLADRAAATRSALATLDQLPADVRLDGVRAVAHVEQSYVRIEAMDLAGARRSLAAAAKKSASATDETLDLWITSLQGAVEVIAGKPGGLDKMAGVAHEARDRGFEDAGVTAYRDAAVSAARVLDYRRAEEWIEEGLRYADSIEQSHCAHVMRSTRALVAWADGRWDDAVAHAEHALADHGCERAAGMARWPLAYVALGRGERAAAREHLDVAAAFAAGSGAPDMALAAAWGEAELANLGGEHETAVRVTQQALELARESGERARFTPLVVTGVRARISAGRPADAERWLAEVTELLARVRWYAGPALDHAAGLVSLLQGSTGAARRSLEAAVAGWDERPRTWESLWARLDLAGCLMRSSRYVEAARLITEVRERAAAAAMGAEPLVLRAEEMARRNRRHDTQEQAWHPLTAREYEVAQLIAGGLTNGEIAAELSVSPKTVSAHVEHVLAKLGAARRTEIASWVSLTARPDATRTAVATVPAALH